MRVPDHYAALGIQETADASDESRTSATHPDKENGSSASAQTHALIKGGDEMRTDGLRRAGATRRTTGPRASTAPSTRPLRPALGPRREIYGRRRADPVLQERSPSRICRRCVTDGLRVWEQGTKDEYEFFNQGHVLHGSLPVWKSKFYGAFVLNRRVVLHAIDDGVSDAPLEARPQPAPVGLARVEAVALHRAPSK